MAIDVLVIGGGATGLSTALALLESGLSVTLADLDNQPGTSTWAGAGILSPLPPWGYPEEVTCLALAGMAGWQQWSDKLEGHAQTSPEYWACGMAVERVAEAAKALSWCTSHDLPAESSHDGIWLPTVAQTRNPRLLAAMKQAFTSLGGQLLSECEVTGLRSAGGLVLAAQSSHGSLSADKFVLATGAWSALPLGNLPPMPSIRPIRGQIVLYPPGSHDLRHIVLHDGLYLVPRLDGHLLVGSTLENAGFDARTQPELISSLRQLACERIPSLKMHEPVRSWAGLRPGSPDNIPLIDRHPDFDNLWLGLGHYRYGVTMAPASAQLLVDLMLGRSTAIDPTPYRWNSFLQRSWTAANSPASTC